MYMYMCNCNCNCEGVGGEREGRKGGRGGICVHVHGMRSCELSNVYARA